VNVYRYNDIPEAQRIVQLLEAQDIPCQIQSFENWGYDGIFRGQIGMGEIIVPDNFSDKAKEVIDEFVKEEKEKDFKGDKELRIIKITQNIQSYKIAPYFFYAWFMMLAYFILFKLRHPLISIVGLGLLVFGLMRSLSYFKNELEKSEKELEEICKKKEAKDE